MNNNNTLLMAALMNDGKNISCSELIKEDGTVSNTELKMVSELANLKIDSAK